MRQGRLAARPWAPLAHVTMARFDLTCHHCSAAFEATYPLAKWCSRRCEGKARAIRLSKAPLPATAQCAVCSVPYRPRSDDRTPTCGRICSKRYPRLFKPAPFSRLYESTCNCGRAFLSRRKRATCSEVCEKRRLADLSRIFSAGKKPSIERQCKECAAAFVCGYGDKRRGYCSDACSRKTARRIARPKRRALIRGATVKAFDPLFVLARDKWICQLCGISTPKRLRGTLDDRAPELDHIIPLSKGGAHSADNTQCACRRCNREKGDKVLGQLLIAA